MEHLAIMKKDWHLVEKILSGEKKIESRWYKARFEPWNKVKTGDVIYFKETGEPVTAKASVEKVLQQEVASDSETKRLIKEYGGSGGICFPNGSDSAFDWCKGKRYSILMFLKNPQKIERPFYIDKTGYGNARAWICVNKIDILRMKQ